MKIAFQSTTLLILLCGISNASPAQWKPPSQSQPATTVTAQAQKEASEFNQLLQNPNPLTKEAVETFAIARALYREAYFVECQKMLADFWVKYPREYQDWGQQHENVGYKLGYPCGYPALVMLTDAVEWRVKEKSLPKPVVATDWNLVALLVGKASGNMPANDEEAKVGKGKPISTTIDPELLADKNAILHDTIWLTREYYLAMTEGKINLRFSVLHLKNVEFEQCAPGGPGGRTASWAKLPSAIPPEIDRQADWYWLIYPEIEAPKDAQQKYYLASFNKGGTCPSGMTSIPGIGKPMIV